MIDMVGVLLTSSIDRCTPVPCTALQDSTVAPTELLKSSSRERLQETVIKESDENTEYRIEALSSTRIAVIVFGTNSDCTVKAFRKKLRNLVS